jgi:hypothetical protein
MAVGREEASGVYRLGTGFADWGRLVGVAVGRGVRVEVAVAVGTGVREASGGGVFVMVGTGVKVATSVVGVAVDAGDGASVAISATAVGIKVGISAAELAGFAQPVTRIMSSKNRTREAIRPGNCFIDDIVSTTGRSPSPDGTTTHSL